MKCGRCWPSSEPEIGNSPQDQGVILYFYSARHGHIPFRIGSKIDRMTRHSFSTRLGGVAVWSATALAVLALGTKPSIAADVRVFTSGAPAEVEKVLATKYAEMTGNRISFTVGTLSAIQAKLSGVKKPDIVVLPVPAMEALEKMGTLRPGSRIDLARVGIGVVVREGAPLRDISTVDALRKLLLDARSIAHPDPLGGGLAGVQIARMFAQLGISDAIKPKVTLMYAIAGGVAAVAKGDAEIGLFNISEILPVKGVTLVGPLPPELQTYITFSGALHVGSASPEPALTFLRSLSDSNARDAWKMGGFEPLGGGR
jgi:molybdate transport system substrate-binding protein